MKKSEATMRMMLQMTRDVMNALAENVAEVVFFNKREMLEEWASTNTELINTGNADEMIVTTMTRVPGSEFMDKGFMDAVAGELEELIDTGEIFDVPVCVLWDEEERMLCIELDV